jgi:thiamine-monophosphate kinase
MTASEAAAMSLGEFELIRRFFRGSALERAGDHAAITLGIGDDAALLRPYPEHQLVVSTDTLVEGVHFPSPCDPADLAYRALAVAVSDIAAMAARPLGFTLALTLPEVDEAWMQAFATGLAAAAEDFRIALIGGDTTRGPLNIGVTVIGSMPVGREMRRSGAQAGDLLCVGGPLGDGAAGLAVVQQQGLPVGLDQAQQDYLRLRFWRPQAQCELGIELAHIASSGIDVSDGLLAEAGHLAAESGVGIEISVGELPASSALGAWPEPQRLEWMLRGGDDYVLLFTLPPASRGRLKVWRAAGFPVKVIGRVIAGEGVWLERNGTSERVDGPGGYQHFKGGSHG